MITLDLQHASTSYSIIHILKLPLPSTARSLDLLSLFTYLPTLARRRQWHPTPVLLPGKSHGRRSLEGCSRWGHWGSDTTERLYFHFSLSRIGEGNGSPLQYSCLENPRDGSFYSQTKEFQFSNFSGGSVVKNLPANVGHTGDVGSIPGLGRSPGVGNGNPLQYSCLENSTNRRARRATVHGVAKHQIRLSTYAPLLLNSKLYPVVFIFWTALKGPGISTTISV